MDGDTGDDTGRALQSFTQEVGVPDVLVTDDHPNMVSHDTLWARTCREKDVKHLFVEPHRHWQNQAEGAWREIKRLFEKKRVQMKVTRRLSHIQHDGAVTPEM